MSGDADPVGCELADIGTCFIPVDCTSDPNIFFSVLVLDQWGNTVEGNDMVFLWDDKFGVCGP